MSQEFTAFFLRASRVATFLVPRSVRTLSKSRGAKRLHDGRFLMVSFALVTALLLLVGGISALIVNHQNNSVDRFMAAGDLLALLDEARLAELTFTRDHSTELT